MTGLNPTKQVRPMERNRLGCYFGFNLFVGTNTPVEVRYVDVNSANPAPPYVIRPPLRCARLLAKDAVEGVGVRERQQE